MTLAAIVISNEREARLYQEAVAAAKPDLESEEAAGDAPEPQRYQASLILCPGNSIEVWQQDIQKFYPKKIKVFQFFGTESSVTNPDRLKTLLPNNVEALNKKLQELDPFDPEVSSYVPSY